MTALRIRSIMRTDFPALSPDTPIRTAVAQLTDRRIGAAPVIGSDGRLVGILTQKDCFRPALHASYHQEWKGRVGDLMSTDPVTMDATDDIIHAAEMFLTHPHRLFPVVEGNHPVGMLDRSDVLELLLKSG